MGEKWKEETKLFWEAKEGKKERNKKERKKERKK
jgi:hypothetical protein